MYETVFENDKIIIVAKEQGVVVEPDEKDDVSLIESVKTDFGSDAIRLCHRLDRNTGGLIILAKSDEIYDTVVKLMESKDIKKTYNALCFGKVGVKNADKSGTATLHAFHFKDAKKGLVYISDFPKKYYKDIITKYRLIGYDAKKNISKLEITLVTGRTHQIRAQFAHLGHPVVGDGKYGKNVQNKAAGYRYQALFAVKLDFSRKAQETLNVPAKIVCRPNFK